MLSKEQEDERSVATGDDSSNAAGLIKNIFKPPSLKFAYNSK
ncbi:MAG: hypothetical protein WDN26_07460 [Chitinophagaceae bacterium]